MPGQIGETMKFMTRASTRLILTVCLLLPAGCGSRDGDGNSPESEKDSGTPVEVMTIEPADITSFVTATGAVDALYDARVSAETSGRVEAVLHEVGSEVERGGAVIRLDATTQRLNMKQAEARLRVAGATRVKAERDLKRMEELFAGHDIAEAEIEQARLLAEQAQGEHELAEASYWLAKKAFEDAWISAPFTGEVTATHVDIGEMISQGQAAFTIVQIDTVKIQVDISAADIGRVEATQPAEISVTALPDMSFRGEVSTVAIKASESTRTYPVEIVVDNRDHRLRPGMLADVGIVTGRRADVIAIPLDAVLQRNGSSVAFIEENGIAVERKLEIALQRGEEIIVTRGLATGERLIVVGQHSLEDGRKVIVTD